MYTSGIYLLSPVTLVLKWVTQVLVNMVTVHFLNIFLFDTMTSSSRIYNVHGYLKSCWKVLEEFLYFMGSGVSLTGSGHSKGIQ